MELHSLKPNKGALKSGKRIGRGQGSTRGGTSTKGHKGQKSRSGYSKKIGFEGGQMPLQRRVPKFGFKNPNRKEFKAVNLYLLEELATKLNVETITKTELVENGIVAKKDKVKVLAKGEITKKIDIEADAFSKTAVSAIEKVGGKVSIISQKGE